MRVGRDDNFVGLFEFDASALRRTDLSKASRMVISRETDCPRLGFASSAWADYAKVENVPSPTFSWPSVFSFHPTATTLSLTRYDDVAVKLEFEAVVQFYPEWIVRCPFRPRVPTTYVTFLEVAPWNRKGPRQQFGGLGALLLQYVSARSFAGGQDGSLGLHSVAAAAGFYERLGFMSLDCPNEYHELYWVLSADKALALRARGGF
jgi:hypothetical protein